ncbi:MAG TPA: RNase adapter RapZ [Actinomycetaceae bacterium]|nr:RNase adapter RapZ [Actinomycetaceae bacterium]
MTDEQPDAATPPDGLPLLDRNTQPPKHEGRELLIITGMSGAGKSRAANTLEDLDWFVVDNLPPGMLEPLARMMQASSGGVERIAAVVDVRSGEFFNDLLTVVGDLRRKGVDYRIMFLDASDEELVRRFEQVRRAHPLQGEGRILDGLAAERELLSELRDRADLVVDTTNYNIYDLARDIRERIGRPSDEGIQVTLVSFGFKHGLPMDADYVADVRFLSNPYWVNELRHLTGKDSPVSDYVLEQDGAREFIERYAELLLPVLDGFERELKPYLTVAIGCTGGRHRSVAMTEQLAEILRANGQRVRTLHRDVGRE